MRNLTDKIRSPFTWRLFVVLIVVAASLYLKLLWLNRSLVTSDARYGIFSLQMAWSPCNAAAIVESWKEAGVADIAVKGLMWDFLFLVIYSTMLALGCFLAAGAVSGGWRCGIVALAWGQWCAGLLDAIENVLHLGLLSGPILSPWPQIATVCATVKFALVIPGVLCCCFLVVRAGCMRIARRVGPGA